MAGWNETPEEAGQRTKHWRACVGDWLRGYEWTLWLTLTVEGFMSPERLRRAFIDEFVRFATKASQGPVPYVFVIEVGPLGGRIHIHSLLFSARGLSSSQLEAAWRYGRAQVRQYEAWRGAAYYLVKEIGGRVLDYDVSRRLPPLRVTAMAGSVT